MAEPDLKTVMALAADEDLLTLYIAQFPEDNSHQDLKAKDEPRRQAVIASILKPESR